MLQRRAEKKASKQREGFNAGNAEEEEEVKNASSGKVLKNDKSKEEDEDAGRLLGPSIPEICLQILQAVNYCHSLNVVHRDLKLENCLLKDKTPEALVLLSTPEILF